MASRNTSSSRSELRTFLPKVLRHTLRPALYCGLAVFLFGSGYLWGQHQTRQDYLAPDATSAQNTRALAPKDESQSEKSTATAQTGAAQRPLETAPPSLAKTKEQAGAENALATTGQPLADKHAGQDAPPIAQDAAQADTHAKTAENAQPLPAKAEADRTAAGHTQADTAAKDSAGQNSYPFARASDPFLLRKLGSGHGPTLLVLGGIQGDEPGGFSAAALLATHYRIRTGSVWVVPDLNFPSILQRHRGLFGDMNRKFAAIDSKDPEFDTITRIKNLLLNEQVDLILNLHDGSGFYRPVWEDALHNPKRWGQSVIIDQASMDAPRFNSLFETAGLVESEVNQTLLEPGHRYHTYNTLTAQGNVEMAKTLSWFAVRNGKPAFGIEASKEFGTEYRAYYHLNVVEAFMRRMGIEYEREFELSPAGVMGALNSGLALSAFDGRLVLELDDARPVLHHVPFKKNAAPAERISKPLLALVKEKERGAWRVAYGNRTVTRLNPDYLDFDDSLSHVEVVLDGQKRRVALGEALPVQQSFLVKGLDGYRVNAIGAQKEVNGTEADVELTRADFLPRFSVDKKASLFRVEIYKGKAFAGMLLLRFTDGPHNDSPLHDKTERPLTAEEGAESDLGM